MPDLASKLSHIGIRLTRQRRVLLDIIENARDHLHASDLLQIAQEQDPGIDRATVYRTLALLKEHGLVEELDLLHLDGAEHHYELKGEHSHVHIGCIRCGKIIEFESELVQRLERDIEKSTGSRTLSTRIEVSAVCSDCQQAQ